MSTIFVGLRTAGVAAVLAAGCGRFSAEPEPAHVVVRLRYPGASPSEVEQALLLPTEEALYAVKHVEDVLAIGSSGKAELHVRTRHRVPLQAQQAVLEALRTVDSWPEAVELPVAFLRPARGGTWVQAGADAAMAQRATGELAHQGVLAQTLATSDRPSAWVLQPAALSSHGLSARSVAQGLGASVAAGQQVGAATQVADGVRLEQVARHHTMAAEALLDGSPAGLIQVSTTAEIPGWTSVSQRDSGWSSCAVSRQSPAEAGLDGVWLRKGAVWVGRVGKAREVPGIDVWSCDEALVRVAVSASDPSVDLDEAVRQLQADGAWRLALDVPIRDQEPTLVVEPDALALARLGMSSDAVQETLTWSAEISGTVLRWPVEDPVAVGQIPIVREDGRHVLLDEVSAVRLKARPAPIVRVGGRRARVLDVLPNPGGALHAGSTAPVSVRALGDLGPAGELW